MITMSEKRVTKKENLTEIRGIVEGLGREDLVAFVDNELTLLAKRASRNTLTKTQKENLELVETVFDALSNCDKAVTVSELIAADERISAYSNQKVSALLKKLVDTERVVKVVEKGKAYFSIAD